MKMQRTRGGVLVCLGLGAGFVGGGCGGEDGKAPGAQGHTVQVEELQVGACVTPTGEDDFVRTFDPKGCDVPHALEVAGSFELPASAYPGGDYPGNGDLVLAGYTGCEPIFEAYVGVSVYDSERYDIRTILPAPSTWVRGDRTIICMVVGDGGAALTARARDAKR